MVSVVSCLVSGSADKYMHGQYFPLVLADLSVFRYISKSLRSFGHFSITLPTRTLTTSFYNVPKAPHTCVGAK